MKMEEHFKEALNRAVANEPPALDAWDRFEQRVGRGRRVRLLAGIAAAAAVAVASVIVVPKLGTDDSIKVPPLSSPTQTADAYAGWKTYDYDLYEFKLRYPTDWKVVVFEANPEVLAPGQVATAAGETTMAVTLALFDQEAYNPGWPEFGFDRGTRPDGRTFLRHITDPLDSGGRRIEYSIDWSTCFGSNETPSCVRRARTLFVSIHIGTKALGDQYGGTAERIVNSIEYAGT